MNWPKDIKEAKEIQLGLREDVRILALRKRIECIAGVDAAFFENNVIATVCEPIRCADSLAGKIKSGLCKDIALFAD